MSTNKPRFFCCECTPYESASECTTFAVNWVIGTDIPVSAKLSLRCSGRDKLSVSALECAFPLASAASTCVGSKYRTCRTSTLLGKRSCIGQASFCSEWLGLGAKSTVPVAGLNRLTSFIVKLRAVRLVLGFTAVLVTVDDPDRAPV